MKTEPSVTLPGSFKKEPGLQLTPSVKTNEQISVTIRLKRKNELIIKSEKFPVISHSDFQESYGASREDADLVTAFLRQHAITVTDTDLARRSIFCKGNSTAFEEAFKLKLDNYENEAKQKYRIRTGDIYIPESLKNIIVGIFGLDNRPVARPMFKILKKEGQIVSHAATPASFKPNQLADIYGFPAGSTGKGQCIAIIELGGGYRQPDITSYFKSLNIPAPNVSAVLIDNAKNAPSDPNGADGEVMLDIEVAGAVAPGAKIIVYFTPNTDKGFLDAITAAIHDTANRPSVISISWGSAEINWTQQATENFNEAFQSAAALGVSICVAAGDSGSSDGETDGKVHVDFPASSPYALACGGTSLKTAGNKISSEVVWHDSNDSATGGGVSEVFAVPAYQQGITVPVSVSTKFKGRGLPDVAANADPDTGYQVLVDGQEMVIGGTSAVAPLMAGLLARINEQQGKNAGFIHPLIYSKPSLCRDITKGNNKTTAKKTGYTAKKGWDACTGWGVLASLS